MPENSLAAFTAAVDNGYGVELDVQFTRDKRVVVFHDDTLKRACAVDARVDEYTYQQLLELPLFNTEHRIPLFSEVLSVLAGKVPVIVELKATKDYAALCQDTLLHLLQYQGHYCVESFDPHIVRWFKRNAPQIVRGQLSEPYAGWRHNFRPLISLFMSRLWTNIFTRPHFIAFGIHGRRNLSWYLCKALGAMMVCWTARPQDSLEKLKRQYDATIFEHFFPNTRYW